MFDANLNERQSRIDRLQLAALLGLMLLGAAFVYSATMVSESARPAPLVQPELVPADRLVCARASARRRRCAAWITTRWPAGRWWSTGSSMLLLVAVLIPRHRSRFGRAALDRPGLLQLQPSEFAKLAFILAQAHFLSRPVEELRVPLNLLEGARPDAAAVRADPEGARPRLGAGAAADRAGHAVRGRHARALPAAAGRRRRRCWAPCSWWTCLFAPPNWQIKLEDYQRRRLLVYFGRGLRRLPVRPKAEQERLRKQQFDDSHNVRQALISVGSGGLTGKGWRQGTQNALGYLPRAVAHNDFIFSVIAEEKGFVGSVIVLTLYGVVLFTGIRIAGQARDRLGKMWRWAW